MFKKILFAVVVMINCKVYLAQQYSWNLQGITVAGGNGAGDAGNQLNFPYSVFIAKDNSLYITDTQNHRIVRWDVGATQGITVAGGNGAGFNADQLNTPTCVWVDSNKDVYIVDSFNARIQKWENNATNGTTVAGGNGEGNSLNQLNKPGGFYVKGNAFYVVDSGNNRIVKWLSGAASGTSVAGGTSGSNADQFANPTVNGTIYVDDLENLYVTDYINNRIQKFATGTANAITVAGGNGSGTPNNQMKAPNGFGMMNGGTMIIAEYTGRRILAWKEGQSIETVVAGGNGNGSGANQFKSPRGVFIASNGDLYVTDMGNHRIQKFTFTGSLSTQEQISNNNSTSVYPNPAKDILKVSTEYKVQKVKIFDTSGREVSTNKPNSEEFEINVNSLVPGNYFLQLSGETKQEVIKIIKK